MGNSLSSINWLMKVKAGALQYAIFSSILIILLITALLSVVFLHLKLSLKSQYYSDAIKQENRCFSELDTLELDYNSTFTLQENNNRISITKENWGLFDIVAIKVINHNEQIEKWSMMGRSIEKKTALYISDSDKNIVLAGNSKIVGNAYIPNEGITAGNILGEGYYDNEMIYGDIFYSSNFLPPLSNRSTLMTLDSDLKNRVKYFINLQQKDVFINSFSDTLQYYYSNNIIYIKNKTLRGKILIKSDSLIQVDKNSTLNDVILMAPHIRINDNFKGNLQLIATKSIYIGQGVNLTYPTGIGLFDKSTATNPNIDDVISIYIDENSKVEGSIVYLTDFIDFNKHYSNIFLKPNSIVKGNIYCENYLDLRGTLEGSVYTNRFLTNEKGTVYINHLFNGVINRTTLSDDFVGTLIGNNEIKVIQWLN